MKSQVTLLSSRGIENKSPTEFIKSEYRFSGNGMGSLFIPVLIQSYSIMLGGFTSE